MNITLWITFLTDEKATIGDPLELQEFTIDVKVSEAQTDHHEDMAKPTNTGVHNGTIL